MSYNKIIFYFYLLSVILSGCILSPNLPPRETTIPPKNYLNSNSTSFYCPTEWWKIFSDNYLNSLIKTSLLKNFDLKQSMLTLIQLKKQLDIEKASLYPNINLEGKIQREGKYLQNVLGEKYYSLTNTYSAFLITSYELDLFQKLSAQRVAAWMEVLENKYSLKSFKQSLISSLVNLYLQLSFEQNKIDIYKKILKLEEKNLLYLEKSYNQGYANLADILAQKQIIENLKNTILESKKHFQDIEYQICSLMGKYPQHIYFSAWHKFSKIKLKVNPGLPSLLLKSRPDILAKENKLKKLEAKVKVARRARFPKITLTGQFGYASTELQNLFTPTNALFRLAAGILQPIFQAGKLKKQEDIAILEFQKAEIDYAKTILTAFKEVELALFLRQVIDQQEKHFSNILKLKQKKLQLTQYKYSQGQISFLELNHAKKEFLEALLNKEKIHLNSLLNQVNLIKALGGNWG